LFNFVSAPAIAEGAMRETSTRLFLASIHDVSPRFEKEVDALVETLWPHVGLRFAMLVVPDHWGSSPIRPGSPFASRLRAWADSGVEILLHGFTHRDESQHRGLDRFRARFLTAKEGEFLGLSTDEAARRISNGRALIEDIIGSPVTGFVAPAWLYGPGAIQALAESGMDIAEDHMRVWSPKSGRRLAGGPVITWASRTPARLCSSLAAAAVLRRIAPQRTLRIGVHPGDCRSPALLRSIGKTLSVAATSRLHARYGDLARQ
jgi:predicted deacetylase